MTLTRGQLADIAAELEASLGAPLVVPAQPEYRPRYNIAPTDLHFIVLNGHPREQSPSARLANVPGQLASARWGFRNRSYPLINARAETLEKRGLFSSALRSPTPESRGRCLVPADGFYEWVGAKKDRHPIWFHRPDGKLLLCAGLYQVEPEGGLAFTVITTAANLFMTPVHDRMPALLAPDGARAWLVSPRPELLAPAPEDALIATYVSDRASSVANDDPDCLTPARQMKLF